MLFIVIIACTGAPEIHRALPVGRLDVTTLIGESRTYVCEKGYVQTGTITAVCNGDLTWTISKTRCKGNLTPTFFANQTLVKFLHQPICCILFVFSYER